MKSAGLALVICAAAAPVPAFAGFQWIAPGTDSGAQPLPSVTTAPQMPVTRGQPQYANQGPEIISPVVISGGNNQNGQYQDNSGEMAVYNGSVGMSPGSNDTLRAPMPSTSGSLGTLSMAQNSPDAAPDSIVQGFAKSVPLVVALRQILPSGYAFSVDANIDMGTPVSFQGGRGWRETLRDALAPAGLAMREQGSMVSIGHANDAASQVMMMPQQPRPTASLSPLASRTGLEPQPLPAPIPVNPTSETLGMPLSSGGGSLMPETGSWSAERGDNLKKVLEQWCRRANVEFDWLAEYDYPLQASVSFNGSFEEAVRSLLAGFEGAHPQPVAELHSNPALKQTVLIVQTRGNTNSD